MRPFQRMKYLPDFHETSYEHYTYEVRAKSIISDYV
jgi:hypothetical protein